MLHPSDRQLILTTIFLILLQMALLFSNTYWWPGEGWLNNESKSEHSEIGTVVQSENKVKRRNQGSVVWEDAVPSDVLISYDSVMTLNDSSADIELNNQVKVQLHENTLVVLEPDESADSEVMRLRFSKGTLQSKTDSESMEIFSDEWQMKVEPGTELSLKGIDGKNVEVEVHRGEIKVNGQNRNPSSIAEGHRIRIDANLQDKVQQLSNDLKFTHKREERIYTHDLSTQFILRWAGTARSIRWIRSGFEEMILPVTNNVQELQMSLPKGTHYLSLQNNNISSEEIMIRVLQAPLIRYTTPLPRDRFEKSSQILFGWIPVHAATTYELVLTSEKTEKHQALVTGSQYRTTSPFIGEVQMKVFGIDELGFKIPPAYSLPLYFVDDPLAAPILNAPVQDQKETNEEDRSPSGKNSFLRHRSPLLNFLSHFFGSMAEAQSNSINKDLQIKFSWSPVSGADFYTIEISPEPDFLNPDVIAKVGADSYVWTQFQKKVYYWRVAAGANSGRMGYFSNPAVFDLRKMNIHSRGEVAPGVSVIPSVEYLERLKIQKRIAPQGPIKKTKSDQQSVDQVAVIIPEPEWAWAFDTELILSHYYLTIEKDFQVAFSGLSNFSLGANVYTQTPALNDYQTMIRYSQLTAKAKDEKTLRYQKEMSFYDLEATILKRRPDGEISLGLMMDVVTNFKRTGYETIAATSSYLYGIALGYEIRASDSIKYQVAGGLLYGNDIYSLKLDNHLRYQWKSESPYYMGGNFQVQLLFGPDSLTGFTNVFGLSFGRQW